MAKKQQMQWTQRGAHLVAFFQCQVCQHRIEIDRNSSATKGIVAVKIDMLPSSWKDLLQKGQRFGIFARLILGAFAYPREKVQSSTSAPANSSTSLRSSE
jgi:hypothetical protein